MQLNIFTHCSETAPSVDTIEKTYRSFLDAFGAERIFDIATTVYLDKTARPEAVGQYLINLTQVFDASQIVLTNGLADGYVKSIKDGTEDYLFQLEHDWLFEGKYIKHSLKQILAVMEKEGIYNLRFNKHTNEENTKLRKWQSFIRQTHSDLGMNYCETDNMSNNPHIIDRKYYLENILDRIVVDSASFGIEEMLTKKDLISCVYGGLGYPPTIKHQGRITKKKKGFTGENKVKAFFLNDLRNNCGDMLTKPVLEYFGFEVELVGRNVEGKMLAVGSVMSALRRHDIVWGTGCIRNKAIAAPPCRFLAVRGPKTRGLIRGEAVPEVYGDPALLLPLIYNPDIERIHDVGILPHYVDKEIAPVSDGHFIDIQSDWQNVVREVKSCKKIISSTLHGIVIAEAYGIPAEWAVYSDKIIGGDFKFQDYFLGTGRKKQRPGVIPPIKNLKEIQDGLIKALKEADLWQR